MSNVIKGFLTLVVSVLTLFVLGIVYLTMTVNPNDFKPEIKSAAASQGVELSLDGDIGWQFFPQIGIVVTQVEFIYSPVASGKIGQLGLSVSWSELFDIDLSSNRLPVGSIEINNATLQLAELAPNTPPIQLKKVNASIKNLSTNGRRFPLSASAEIFNDIAVAIDAKVEIDVDTGSTQPIINKMVVSDLYSSVDNLQVTGQFSAQNNFATAQGKLQSNHFDLKQLLNKVGKTFPEIQLSKMVGNQALTDISWKSDFNANSSGFSVINTQLNIDNQPLTVTSKIDHSINNLMLRVDGKQFDLSNYMSAESSTQQNGALFAPLALPFALWLGQSQMELSLDKLVLPDFDVDHLYINLFGNQSVLQMSSFNADIFDGQVNATGRLDMRPKTPTFKLQTSVSNIALQSALSTLAESDDISGQLNLEMTIEGAGNNGAEIMGALRGGGQLSIASPQYNAINAEQLFCDTAALFGSDGKKSDWAEGTQFDTLSGRFSFDDGKLLIQDLKTAAGNIAITSQGTVRLAEQRFAINANARVNGSSTSASGCSVNKRLQNRSLPFICSGSFAENGKTNCKPDDNLIKDMLKNSVYEKLGEKIFKTPVTTDDGQTNSDPLKSLFKGILNKNLK